MQRDSRFEGLPVRYVGAVDDVFPFLAEADVGLLPTFFASESLPNSVIEYLLFGLPAIVTDYAELPAMIASEKGDAGITIGLKDGRPDIDALAAAMYAYATDSELFAEHIDRAALAAKKFGMDRIIDQYSTIVSLDLDRGFTTVTETGETQSNEDRHSGALTE